ncbi:bifunctional metallophosphatase/5'-nucleotidase [Acholeplasma granularum]|uniref:bifunctional metallophosphatase/5'-nucleotidase n=1 Tax=Acholeplasma granularum TaxID=264635 RepID=UPI00047107B3|nr:5'-nucleotidase C-terminal domain-containing protein [Acholeplasma granularum]
MKKIFIIFTMLLSIILVSCQEEKKLEIIFNVDATQVYYIGDNVPDYYLSVEVKLLDDTDLKGFLTINDDQVDYLKKGIYKVEFTVNYLNNTYKKDMNLIVESKLDDSNNTTDLYFYYINDLHGALLPSDDSLGLANIGNLILNSQEKYNDKTIFLSGGDMLQGQLISNWYDGASVISVLNDLDMDAFVLGNHEFDWGIEEVTQYFNGNNEVQANFDLLGANVYSVETNQMINDVKPYTIIEKSGIKIAIIGTMGYDLERSIAYTRIKDYKFIDPVYEVEKYAKHVREFEGADIVVAINHDDSSYFNNSVANFTGDSQVDLIFNAHTHRSYVRTINNKYVIQSGSSGSNVSYVKLTFNKYDGIINSSANNLNQTNEILLATPNPLIESKLNGYYQEISGLYDEIMKSKYFVSQGELTTYIAKLMTVYFNTDVGIHNYAGTRSNITANESLSYSKLFQISPFDNTVVVVEVTGSELKTLVGEYTYYKEGFNYSMISNSKTYKVAINDYLMGGNSMLRNKENVQYTGVSLHDLFVETVENQALLYDEWTIQLPLIFNKPISVNFVNFTKSMQISI